MNIVDIDNAQCDFDEAQEKLRIAEITRNRELTNLSNVLVGKLLDDLGVVCDVFNRNLVHSLLDKLDKIT